MARRRVIVGVWKDKLTPAQAFAAAAELASSFPAGNLPYVGGIAPPVISTLGVRDALRDSSLCVVAQDVHWPAESGSYIGTTSLDMLTEVGIRYCMIGHSERRRFFRETDDEIRAKIKGCLESGITPIVCVGDSETDLKKREATLSSQIRNATSDPFLVEHMADIVVAYEPVWAISTWRSDEPLPTGSQVAEMLDMVREVLHTETGADGDEISVLFGGSVAPQNADDYFAQPGVDGALVGGASLDPKSMAEVFTAGSRAWGTPGSH